MVDWGEEAEVGVWELLMTREELLAESVDTEGSEEKTPKLEVTGRSKKQIVAEAKRRKAEVKREEQRKLDRVQRVADEQAEKPPPK